jgi:phycocyanin-associated rod protein
MLGQSVISGASSSPSKSRVFIYEVAGLKQSEENDNNSYPFRTSSNIFIKVPYSRMNEEMRRISRMGGKIVNITTSEVSRSNNNDSNDSDE